MPVRKEGTPMKASELNGTHLGRYLTVHENGNSITGELARVDHQAVVITEAQVGGTSQERLGRQWVDLEFLGGYRATVTPRAEVTHP